MTYLLIMCVMALIALGATLEMERNKCNHDWIFEQEHSGNVKLKWYKCSKCGEEKTERWYLKKG